MNDNDTTNTDTQYNMHSFVDTYYNRTESMIDDLIKPDVSYR